MTPQQIKSKFLTIFLITILGSFVIVVYENIKAVNDHELVHRQIYENYGINASTHYEIKWSGLVGITSGNESQFNLLPEEYKFRIIDLHLQLHINDYSVKNHYLTIELLLVTVIFAILMSRLASLEVYRKQEE